MRAARRSAGDRTARSPCSRRSSSTTGSSIRISGGTMRPFISGNVLYANPARMPATKPPDSTMTKTSAAMRDRRSGAATARVRTRCVARRGNASDSAVHSIARENRERERRDARSAEIATPADRRRVRFAPSTSRRALQPAEHEDARERPRVARAECVGARRTTRYGTRNTTPIARPSKPMEVFPPEDALELGERHRVVDVAVLRRRAGTSRMPRPSRRCVMGGNAPTIGCHSVIDRPECVRRVTPPTTTIANTSAQQTSEPADERMVRRGIDCTGARVQGAGGRGVGGRHQRSRNVMARASRVRPARCRSYPRRTPTRRSLPAFSNVSVSGNLSPTASGFARPTSITW